MIKTAGANHLSYQEHSYISRSRYEEQLPRYFECSTKSRSEAAQRRSLLWGSKRAEPAREFFEHWSISL